MHKRSNAIIALAFLGLGAPAPAGAAVVTTFEAGSLILPVDDCYARSLGGPGNDADVDAVIAPSTQADLKCDDLADKDDGALYTYGLILRLVDNGVPVYWIIKDGKSGWNDFDFEIRPGTGVRRSDYLTGAETAYYDTVTAVQYRGGPFVIAKEDVVRAQALMNTSNFATYEKSGVGPHVAKVSFDAPVFVKITAIPKLAILDVDSNADFKQGDLSTHINAMNDVGLAWGQNKWWFVISPANLRAGKLGTDGYQMLWVPPIQGFEAANETANYNAIVSFLTQTSPGWVLFQDSSIWVMEGEAGGNQADTPAVWSPNQHSPTVLNINGLPGTYGGNTTTELICSDDYSDPFAQHGGTPWQGVGGANKAEWQPSGGSMAYNRGVHPVVYSCYNNDPNDPLSNWMVASWRYYENNANYGRVLYTGGDNVRRNTFSPYRILLNSLLLQPAPTTTATATTTQVTSSAPTVDNIGGISTVFQGTYELVHPSAPLTYTGTASETTFVFPHIVGHMLGINGDDFSGSVNYDAITSIFDANTWLQNLATPITSRKVFTTLGSGSLPAKQTFTDGSTEAGALSVSLSRPSGNPTSPPPRPRD